MSCLLGGDEVLGRDPEPPRGNLLDGRRRQVAVLELLQVREGGGLAALRGDVLDGKEPDGVFSPLLIYNIRTVFIIVSKLCF